MEFVDLNQIMNTVIAGGAIYAGIRVEIRLIWRDLGLVRDDVKDLRTLVHGRNKS